MSYVIIIAMTVIQRKGWGADAADEDEQTNVCATTFDKVSSCWYFNVSEPLDKHHSLPSAFLF